MKITQKLLKELGACREGSAWVNKKFPQGAEYVEVQNALRDEKLYDWSRWLADKVYGLLIDIPEEIAAMVASEVILTINATNGSPNYSSGDYSKAASSGDGSKAASRGDGSKAASSGDYSTAASSGYGSTAASSGDCSTAASSGDGSKAASSGDGSKAASSGDGSTAAAEGKKTIAMVAGLNGRAKAGKNGAFALPWMDGDQVRIAVGVIGENVKEDIWYSVNKLGQLEAA